MKIVFAFLLITIPIWFPVWTMSNEDKEELFINQYFWSVDSVKEVIFVYDDFKSVEPKVFEDFIYTVFPLVKSCDIEFRDNCIGIYMLLNMKLSQYPEVPQHNYLDIPKINNHYSVVRD